MRLNAMTPGPDDLIDLLSETVSHSPSGGRVKQWLAGAILAAVPVAYGAISLHLGYTSLFVHRGGGEILKGEAGMWLAISYIAVGAFIHFHYFWGLSRLPDWMSAAGKFISLLVMIGAFCYSIWLSMI